MVDDPRQSQIVWPKIGTVLYPLSKNRYRVQNPYRCTRYVTRPEKSQEKGIAFSGREEWVYPPPRSITAFPPDAASVGLGTGARSHFVGVYRAYW